MEQRRAVERSQLIKAWNLIDVLEEGVFIFDVMLNGCLFDGILQENFQLMTLLFGSCFEN